MFPDKYPIKDIRFASGENQHVIVTELMIRKIKTTSIFSIDYADVNFEQI